MSELDFLLDPIAPVDFFRDHWDQQALHIPGTPDKFAKIYDARMWAEFEGVSDLKAVTTNAAGVQVETPALPHQAGVLFMAGFTICADVSNAPSLAPFLRDFRRDLQLGGGAAFAKLYASNDGKGFMVHADGHHVFVLQISGKKLWRFSRTPVVASPTQGLFLRADGQPYWTDGENRHPACNDDGTPVPPPDAATFDSALLEPGHCLYLPPGTWHVARAVGHSIAVSISPKRATVTDLFLNAIGDLLADRPEWRRDLLAPPSGPQGAGSIDAVDASVAQVIDKRLAELRAALASLDPRYLQRHWMRDVTAGHGQGPNDIAAAAAKDIEIRRSTVFTRADDGQPFRFMVAPDGPDQEERCYFYRDGEWSLPASARAFLTELGNHQEFRAEQALAWDRKLRFDDVRAFLGTLVAAGVLRAR
ncbi:MAG TPA: cupin domain-containing protein [Polyangia bacterium]|nr:cupin domain-containing protein [Polyangia bacterium]